MGSRKFKQVHFFQRFEAEFLGGNAGLGAIRFQPSADVYETENALVVKIELAGVRPDRLEMTLSAEESLLTITGERTEQTDSQQEPGRYHQLEIFYGTFEREIRLPDTIRLDRERIAARYQDGILTITLPKREETLHTIAVHHGESEFSPRPESPEA